jgi:hypothetical protein
MLANTGPITCPNTTIRLGHSNLAALTTTFASNLNVGSPVIVLNDATVNVPATATTWFDIPLTTPFDYNGVDNLVVQVDRTTVCQGTAVIFGVNSTTSAAGRRAFSAAADTTAGTAQNNTTTGALDTIMPWMRFVFAGGDNKMNFGGVDSNFFPFSANKRTQHLYLASEINGSGPITGIAFQVGAFQATVAGTYTYTLRLGHSTLTQLGDTFASNYAGSPTTVANAVANFTIPANMPSGEWFWVPIPDGVFTYNGTDSLIVDVSVPSGTANNNVAYLAGGVNRRLFNNSDAAATTGTLDGHTYHIALRFHGGAVSVITNGNTSTAFAFNTGVAGRLNLYRASELGSAGTITSVACRMVDAVSTATSYANYRVIIGHSNVASLSATSSDNFVSQTTAVSGTISVPAALSRGDWIEVPLSTPFAYDGKSNLAIWMGTTAASGAAANHTCFASLDAARHPGQIASGEPGAAAVGVQDAKFDMRLRISR